MSFAIDTGCLDAIRSDLGYSCIPKILSAYNTVVSVRNNLPSSVTGKKWNWSNLISLKNDIDNINDDVVKIQNLLYKAVEKMNDAERRALRWNSLKNTVVTKGRAVVNDIKDFGYDLYDDYQEAKEWFENTCDAVYQTGCEVVESVENWVENLTWEDVEEFFKTAGATIVVAFQSLLKGLITLMQTIADLAIIVGTVVVTPFTALADGVNYLVTGESGGFTKYYWDGAMNMVADVGSLAGNCCNWLTDNNPDWVNEYSLIEAGGTIDQIIQGIGYMVGIIGITVATFGAATPAALACTAGTLGFAKGTAEAWAEGKDALGGLIMGSVNGFWEGLQYYVGGKIGTSVFGKVTGKIANPVLQKLAVSGLRVVADSFTGAIEVPFQSVVAMIDTRVDDIEGNELSWDEAWHASGGWIGVIEQTAIAGLGSAGGEIIDFGKAFKNTKGKGTTYSSALSDIYFDDINTAKLNRENPFGKKRMVPEVDVVDNVEKQIKSKLPNDSIDDGAIAMANYRANKGTFTSFKFEDASNLPELDSNFWKNIEHPEQTFIYVDGKNMTFDEALIYKQSYTSYSKNINMGEINNLNIKNLDYADVGMPEAAAARLTSNAKRYIYNDTNDFIGLNSRIADNGLYHFTDAPDAILNSGYIKATGEKLKGPLGYLGPAYGNAKTFFFEGIPDVGAFATNLDDIPLKTTAVKIKPTSDILDSSNLKIRNLDDGAITWDGRFNLLNQNPTKEYFVLTVDNGKLKYMNVPESIYNSYDNSAAGKQLSEFLSNKKNIQAIKDDYLVNTSFRNTNASVSNNITHTSVFDKSRELLKDNGGFVGFKNKNNIDIVDNIDNQFKNSFPNDSIDDGAIAMANYWTSKGMTQQFRFSDPSNIPDLDSSFWKNIDNPDKIIINVNGRQMSFDDAISYKANYDLNMKDVFVGNENNVIFNKDDISALLAKAEITDYHTQWGKRKLSSWAHSNFDGVFGSDQIEELFSRVYKVDDKYWGTLLKERGLPDNILGFVDRNSQLYLPQRANEHSAYHELFHQLSEINGRNSGMKIQTADGQLVKITGIREYFADGFNSTLANESLTDFLASKYGDGLLYESMYSIENVKYWNRIDDAITKIYGSENSDILLNAYLSNDTSAIRNFFDTYSTKGTYDDFIRKMVPYKSDAVEEIISSIEKNVYRNQSSLSSIIKSIFGRK